MKISLSVITFAIVTFLACSNNNQGVPVKEKVEKETTPIGLSDRFLSEKKSFIGTVDGQPLFWGKKSNQIGVVGTDGQVRHFASYKREANFFKANGQNVFVINSIGITCITCEEKEIEKIPIAGIYSILFDSGTNRFFYNQSPFGEVFEFDLNTRQSASLEIKGNPVFPGSETLIVSREVEKGTPYPNVSLIKHYLKGSTEDLTLMTGISGELTQVFANMNSIICSKLVDGQFQTYLCALGDEDQCQLLERPKGFYPNPIIIEDGAFYFNRVSLELLPVEV